jgi:hypothetical protein
MNPLGWSADTWQWIVIFGLCIDVLRLMEKTR